MNVLPDYLSFSSSLEDTLKELSAIYSGVKIAVLCDENTHRFCYPLMSPYLSEHDVILIPSGEANKNLDTCAKIWDQMTKIRMDRKSVLINLGGGVIGDMGGFCAATYKRGILFIQMPTTLLSQVDASIGGKLGIDFHGFKNHIGLFQDPERVIIHDAFLKTLPERELRSGFAEIIKHHLIRDRKGWEQLRSLTWHKVINHDLLYHSVQIKSAVVKDDPFEQGLRKILNYGHTIGHAVESYFLNGPKPLLHGEAIAAGMVMENYIAEEKGMLDSSESERINTYITGIFPKVSINENDIEPIVEGVYQDKKNAGRQVLASLLNKAGEAVWDVSISHTEIIKAISRYRTH